MTLLPRQRPGDFRDREQRRIEAFQLQRAGKQFPGRDDVGATWNSQQFNMHGLIMAPEIYSGLLGPSPDRGGRISRSLGAPAAMAYDTPV